MLCWRNKNADADGDARSWRIDLDLGESGILLLLLSWTFSERPGVHKRRSIQSDTNRFGI